MNIKKLKMPRRMGITSGKVKSINVARRLARLNKGSRRPMGIGHPRVRVGIHLPAGKWISNVRKSIKLKPKLPGIKKGSRGKNKNIIIIHNNTSITSNEDQDNRASSYTVEVKEIASLKEEDVTSIDSTTTTAPPPNLHQCPAVNTNKELEEDRQQQLQEDDDDEEEEEEEEEEDKEMIIALREEKAAIHIQSTFRAHLARRAFRALKSLVKLQAVARGVCVRRQARMALHCINTLASLHVRVRARQLLA